MTPTTYRYSERRHLRGLLYLARGRGPRDRYWHIWIGPLGLHVFWPDLHKSRPGWCWRQ